MRKRTKSGDGNNLHISSVFTLIPSIRKQDTFLEAYNESSQKSILKSVVDIVIEIHYVKHIADRWRWSQQGFKIWTVSPTFQTEVHTLQQPVEGHRTSQVTCCGWR
jgi:hypothetical protein